MSRKQSYKGPQYKKRQREKLANELELAIKRVLNQFDIEDVKEEKPESEWTILDHYIAEYEKQQYEMKVNRTLWDMRG